MRDWKVTWRDTSEMGLPEHMIGTKYLRHMANIVGAHSPEKEWGWTKDLYCRAAAAYGRQDYRTVEKACRAVIAKVGLHTTTTALVCELAALAWERREELGIEDEGGADDQG